MATTIAQAEYVTAGRVRLTRPQLVGTLIGLLLAALLAAIDQSIVGTAEPRIIASLSGFDRYPWVVTAYLLTSTLAVPIFASLSDIHGRKRFVVLGAALFVITSALCGAAGTLPVMPLDGMGQLILFRALQGVGAGMITGLIFAIVGDIFSPRERGRYVGLFSGVWGAAAIFGPTLGGWLTDQWSWRACFWVNLPVGAIAITAIHLHVPSMRGQAASRRVDWAGIATLICCVVPLLLALTWARQHGWASGRVASSLTVATIMLGAFLYVESTSAALMFPELFHRAIGICSISRSCSAARRGYRHLPLFMQGVLAMSATESGRLSRRYSSARYSGASRPVRWFRALAGLAGGDGRIAPSSPSAWFCLPGWTRRPHAARFCSAWPSPESASACYSRSIRWQCKTPRPGGSWER